MGTTTHLLFRLFTLPFFFFPSFLLLRSALLLLDALALLLVLPSRLLFDPSLLFHHCLQCTDALFLRWCRSRLLLLLRFLLLFLLFCVSFATGGLPIVVFIIIFIRNWCRGLWWLYWLPCHCLLSFSGLGLLRNRLGLFLCLTEDVSLGEFSHAARNIVDLLFLLLQPLLLFL